MPERWGRLPLSWRPPPMFSGERELTSIRRGKLSSVAVVARRLLATGGAHIHGVPHRIRAELAHQVGGQPDAAFDAVEVRRCGSSPAAERLPNGRREVLYTRRDITAKPRRGPRLPPPPDLAIRRIWYVR